MLKDFIFKRHEQKISELEEEISRLERILEQEKNQNKRFQEQLNHAKETIETGISSLNEIENIKLEKSTEYKKEQRINSILYNLRQDFKQIKNELH